MKRIWIAIVFLAIAIGTGIGEQVYIEKTYTTINEMLDNEDTDELVDYWHRRNNIIYAFSDHKVLDTLTEAINELETAEDKKYALTEIRAITKTYYENQRISFSNIF